MAQEFCRRYVENIFTKYDTDYSNVLERRELKQWMSQEARSNPLRKKDIFADFQRFLSEVDSNGDNKIDRWELFDYCVKNYNDN